MHCWDYVSPSRFWPDSHNPADRRNATRGPPLDQPVSQGGLLYAAATVAGCTVTILPYSIGWVFRCFLLSTWASLWNYLTTALVHFWFGNSGIILLLWLPALRQPEVDRKRFFQLARPYGPGCCGSGLARRTRLQQAATPYASWANLLLLGPCRGAAGSCVIKQRL